MASESRILVSAAGSAPIAVYLVDPRGVAVVRLSSGGIELVRIIDHPHAWDYAGTIGLFVTPERVLFATLSTAGLRLIPVDLRP